MTTSPIRVMIIDDSALVRRMLSDCLQAVPGFEVVATSDDGSRVAELYERYKPQVITLDIQMPKCDGLATLDLMMAHAPVPIVMVSTLTKLGAEITLEALDRGAVDYVAKPESAMRNDTHFAEELVKKIKIAASTNVERLGMLRKIRMARRVAKPVTGVPAKPAVTTSREFEHLRDKLVAIGISTGGPPALTTLFESFQSPMPPIVVVQHMPPTFTKSFAKRLDAVSAITVKEAETGDVLIPNHAYIAPGGMHLEIVGRGKDAKLQVREGEAVTGHKPSVDVMMQSAARVFGNRILGVIMTGMGRDGVLGCQDIRAAGGYVLGQDAESSDVYGMNKIAFTEGHVDKQFALGVGAREIMQFVKKSWQGRGLESLAR